MKMAVVSFLIAFFIISEGCSDCFASAPSSKSTSHPVLKGEIDTFAVLNEDVQHDLGFKCKAGADGKIQISDVRLGTEAYYNGLQVGDKVLKATVDGTHIMIGIDRNGATYTARLRHYGAGQDIKLVAQVPKAVASTTLDANAVNLTGAAQNVDFSIDAKRIKILSNYQMQIIMDRSLSMQAKDCPGGLSRWDWCGVQATSIAKALEPYVPSGLTLIPFNAGFDVFDKASPKQIVEVFNDHSFILGTRLCEPLTFVIDKYFEQHKPGDKPLLLVVITDGEPWPVPEPEQCKQELISASQRMSDKEQIAVVFMQIGGNDQHGRDYLVDLDTGLVAAGAKYPFVHTRTFEELTQIGLAQALIETVEKYGVSLPPPSSNVSKAKTAGSK